MLLIDILEISHNDISLVYENSEGKEAVLTYTPETKAIYGTFEVFLRSPTFKFLIHVLSGWG